MNEIEIFNFMPILISPLKDTYRKFYVRVSAYARKLVIDKQRLKNILFSYISSVNRCVLP